MILLALLASTAWFGFATYRDYSILMLDAVGEANLESAKHAEFETRIQKAEQGPDDDMPDTDIHIPGILQEEVDLLRGNRSNWKIDQHGLWLTANGIAFIVLLLTTGFGLAHQMGDFLRFDMGRKIDFVGDHTDDQELFEHAEYLILKGDHVKGIEFLRKVVRMNPDHVEAQLRIANIYDKKLENYELAAGGYEAALKLDFNPERWSWVAVRLCNIYTGKLGDTNRAIKIMRDLVDKHPKTGGAHKVVKRLTQLDVHLAIRRV